MISMVLPTWFLLCVLSTFITNDVETAPFAIQKKSAVPERLADDYPDYFLGVKYDEYPVSFIVLSISFTM